MSFNVVFPFLPSAQACGLNRFADKSMGNLGRIILGSIPHPVHIGSTWLQGVSSPRASFGT